MTREEKRKVYDSARWRRLRRAIAARAGYCCELCQELLSAGDSPMVHHKRALAECAADDPSIYDPRALVYVCRRCHWAAEAAGQKGFVLTEAVTGQDEWRAALAAELRTD